MLYMYVIVVQWSQTVTGYLESHNVASVLVASHFSREEEHIGAIAVFIVKAHSALHGGCNHHQDGQVVAEVYAPRAACRQQT